MRSLSVHAAPTFGIRVITQEANDPTSWMQVIDQARAAEAAGADRVIVSGDHVVFGEHLEAYGRTELGGRPGGKLEIGPEAAFPDPVVAMAALCATTRTIRVMNSLMLAALRRPIVLAKSLASLDALSGGRIDVSVGIGWQREEYDAGGVPLWISGTVNPGAMRRLARFGTGWNPWGLEQDAVIPAIPRMREAVAGFGRDPSEIEVLGHLPLVRGSDGRPHLEPSIANLAPMLEAGVTNVDVFLPIPPEYAAAEEYLSPWVEAFRKATT